MLKGLSPIPKTVISHPATPGGWALMNLPVASLPPPPTTHSSMGKKVTIGWAEIQGQGKGVAFPSSS